MGLKYVLQRSDFFSESGNAFLLLSVSFISFEFLKPKLDNEETVTLKADKFFLCRI